MARKKKIPKPKAAHPGDTFAMPEHTPLPHTSVEMKKAHNGYVVSSYGHPEGEKLFVAKTKKEAHRHAHRLLKLRKV